MNVYSMILSYHNEQRGDFAQNVWHWALEEASDNSPFDYAQELIAAWQLACQDAWLALLPENVILDNITCRRTTGLMGPTAIQGVSSPGGGTAMDGGTLNEGGRIFWVMVDESHLGATIIPGIPGSAMVNQAFTPAYFNLVDDFSDVQTETLTVLEGGGDANFMIQNKDDPLEPQLVLVGSLRDRPSAIGRRTLR